MTIVLIAILDSVLSNGMPVDLAAGMPVYMRYLNFEIKNALFGGQGDRATKN